MIFSGSVASPHVAQGLLRLIELLSLNNPATSLRDAIRTAIPEVPVVVFTPETAEQPAWAVILSNFKLWIVIDGCGTLQHAYATAAGYPGPALRPDTSGRPEHQYYNAIAQAIMRLVTAIPGFAGRDITITGHSLGGAVAQVVALRLREVGVIAARISLVTFGAPRWGNRYQIEALRTVDKCRWMCDQDPVPLMWPRPSEWLGQMLTWNVFQLGRAGAFGQGEGGISIDTIGRLEAMLYPDVRDPGFGPALGAWLWSWFTDRSPNPHHLPAYQYRIDQTVGRYTVPAEVPRPNEQRDLGGQDNARVNSPLAREAIATLRRTERQRSEVPVVIPPARRVLVHHVGGVFTVEWAGQVVATATRRRTAVSLARALNESLNHLIRQGEVDPVHLGQAMQQFLADAADSRSGITPVLQSPFGPAAAPPG